MDAPPIVYPALSLVAALYSSVGHGGASGYLAALALFSFPKEVAAPSALILNVLVASLSFSAFARAGHFRRDLALPFVLASVPAAYLGGLVKLSASAYSLILAAALTLAAARMWLEPKERAEVRLPPLPAALALGAAIGLLSGLIGIGGGVFLSPILLLAGWADAKQTASASAFFIAVNSMAGLAARRHALTAPLLAQCAPMVLAAFAGGLLGSQLGAGFLSNRAIRRTLSLVLGVAAWKLALAG